MYIMTLRTRLPGGWTCVTKIMTHQVFDAFGNMTHADHFHFYETDYGCLFGFTGQMYDADTMLQNNLNRWYDPSIGRWLSEDPPLGRRLNLYRSCDNNPTNFCDPTGLTFMNELNPPGTYPGGVAPFDPNTLAPPPPTENVFPALLEPGSVFGATNPGDITFSEPPFGNTGAGQDAFQYFPTPWGGVCYATDVFITYTDVFGFEYLTTTTRQTSHYFFGFYLSDPFPTSAEKQLIGLGIGAVPSSAKTGEPDIWSFNLPGGTSYTYNVNGNLSISFGVDFKNLLNPSQGGSANIELIFRWGTSSK